MYPLLAPRHASQSNHTAAAVVAVGLDLLLMDSALQHIEQARKWMSEDGGSEKHHLLTAAVQIVGELRSSLDLHEGGPFAANLDDLCEYMGRQLLAANRHNRVETLDEVSDLLREVRTAWVMMPVEARRPSCMTVPIP
jgi:flagellar secretion chaperone FliS